MQPTPEVETPPSPQARQDALAAQEDAQRRERLTRLLQGIDARPDFASLKTSMAQLQRVAHAENSHVRALEALIHNDPGMLSKLLRLSNAAFYRTAGGGEITSMARAVSLLGFEKIAMLASSLMLFDKLPAGADGQRLGREFARAQLAALLAHEVCHSRAHLDHIYLAALFQRLGDMLGGLHFRDEVRAFDDLLDAQKLAPESPERLRERERLARLQWGDTVEAIGHSVAAGWGWPPDLLATMRSLPLAPGGDALSGDAYARTLCTAMNALAGELVRLPTAGTPEEREAARAAVVQRCAAQLAGPLGLDADTLVPLVERTHGAWQELLRSLGMSLPDDAALAAAEAAARPDPNSKAYRQALAEDLADAIDHLTRLNRRGAPLSEVLETAARLLQKALHLQRVVICLLDPARGALQGRLGLGDKAVVLAPLFDVPLNPPADLFGMLCSRNADTLISDITDPVIAQRLPAWFRAEVDAGAFLLLPLVGPPGVLGMIYGDQRQPGDLLVHERALTLLKALRAQVLAALTMARPAAGAA